MDDGMESPPTCGFFSRRAKFNPKTEEELRAAKELVKKIEEENAKISEVEVAPSFSPVPTKKAKRKGKKKVQPKDIKKDVTDDSFSEDLLSSASKRRLKKFREEKKLELQRIEDENQKILSTVDVNSNCYAEIANEAVIEDFEKITVLTIMYMSKISRLRCYENDKFLDIFPKVSKLLNLGVSEFLLCFNSKNITVDDTPKSLNITERDVLECIPYKADEITKTEIEDDGNAFKIMFQSNDTRNKIEILVCKAEKMQNIMKRYAEQRSIPLEQLIFDFDGERLTGDETPADLDMEAESCIDVTVLFTPSPKTPKNTPTRRGRGRGRGRGRKRKSN